MINRRIESVIYFLCIIVSAVMALPGVGTHIGNALAPSDLWQTRQQTLSSLCITYGCLFAMAAWRSETSKGSQLCGLLLSLKTADQGLQRVLKKLWRHPLQVVPSTVLILTLTGAMLRFYFLNQPMRYDESYTFLEYVHRAPQYLFLYSDPNNHVGHTVLVKASVLLFRNSPWAIRLPALAASILAIPIAFSVTRKIFGVPFGKMTAFVMAVHPYLVLYGTNGRGYSLIVLLTLLMLLIAPIRIEVRSRLVIHAMSIIAGIGLLVMPTFLFPLAGVTFWCIACYRSNGESLATILREFLLPLTVWSAILTFVLYTPVILVSNGVGPILSNKFVQSLTFVRFVYQLPAHLAQTYLSMSQGLHVSIVLTMSILLIWGVVQSIRKEDRTIKTLLPAFVIGAMIVLLLKRAIPYPRTWIYLVPIAGMLIEFGLHSLISLISKSSPQIYNKLPWGYMAIAIISAIWIAKHEVVLANHETGSYPDAQKVAEFLGQELASNDSVQFSDPLLSVPVNYYLIRNGKPGVDLSKTDGVKTLYIDSQKREASTGSSREALFTSPQVKIYEE